MTDQMSEKPVNHRRKPEARGQRLSTSGNEVLVNFLLSCGHTVKHRFWQQPYRGDQVWCVRCDEPAVLTTGKATPEEQRRQAYLRRKQRQAE